MQPRLSAAFRASFLNQRQCWSNAYMDFVAVMGSAGLGMSLKEIHIYVSPLKKALQLFWFLGLVGGIGIMVIQVIIDLITSLHPTYI